MSDNETIKKKRKLKYNTSYSNMSQQATEKILQVRISNLIMASIPIEEVLLPRKAKYDVSDTKEKVYDRLVEYLDCEIYPSAAEDDFTEESTVCDIVNAVLLPTLSDFRRKSQRSDMKLHKEKEILSIDGETGGKEEFVIMDFISSKKEEKERKFVLVMEATRSSLAIAFRQLLLALKDMWDTNGAKGVVYGFATTGEDWQMVSYNGKFQLMDKFSVMFPSMGKLERKEKWMKAFSVIVDLMYIALEEGGDVGGN